MAQDPQSGLAGARGTVGNGSPSLTTPAAAFDPFTSHSLAACDCVSRNVVPGSL